MCKGVNISAILASFQKIMDMHNTKFNRQWCCKLYIYVFIFSTTLLCIEYILVRVQLGNMRQVAPCPIRRQLPPANLTTIYINLARCLMCHQESCFIHYRCLRHGIYHYHRTIYNKYRVNSLLMN